MMIRSVIFLSATLLVLSGCKGRSGGGEAPPRTTTVTEQQAIDAARAAVQEHDSFAKTATYEAAAQGNGWVVTVTAGSQVRLIMIDPQGKVVNYGGGE